MKAVKISFAEKYPDLISEWSDRNEIKPDQISYPGYDEYEYNIAPIGHDPFTLISYLSAKPE